MDIKVNQLDFSDKNSVSIVLQGDPHVGSKTFDEERFKRHVNWALRHNAHWINMGDALEGATRDSVGAGVYEQTEIFEEQIDHYISLVKPLVDAGLFIGSHPGNHEDRAYKSVGIDPTKLIAKLTGTKYLGIGVLHYVRVGNQNYTLYTTHGSSGARMPHTKIKKAIDLEKMVEAEIYAMGHLHTLSHHSRQYYEFDKRSRTLKPNERHFIITGSYLKHWGSYAHQLGLEPGKLGSAILELNGEEHAIRVKL